MSIKNELIEFINNQDEIDRLIDPEQIDDLVFRLKMMFYNDWDGELLTEKESLLFYLYCYPVYHRILPVGKVLVEYDAFLLHTITNNNYSLDNILRLDYYIEIIFEDSETGLIKVFDTELEKFISSIYVSIDELKDKLSNAKFDLNIIDRIINNRRNSEYIRNKILELTAESMSPYDANKFLNEINDVIPHIYYEEVNYNKIIKRR